MTTWQGANVVRRKRNLPDDREGRSSETVEAALNRLLKSYSAAMDCVGACFRASSDGDVENIKNRATIIRVAQIARKTLERAVLVDPLVRSNASGLLQEWTKLAGGGCKNKQRAWCWIAGAGVSREEAPITLTSAAHRSTVQKLSYLSLLNYADLLLSGCCYSRAGGTILDRGAVTPLIRSVGVETSCWAGYLSSPNATLDASCFDEPEPDSVRLALVAYMDATQLDGSDPIVWFKLAAAARRLDNLHRSDAPARCARLYRRLEKQALETAQACWWTERRPPNRMIAEAWEEWQKTDGPDAALSPSFDASPNDACSDLLRLELPRYSWAVMGRTLARACREGTAFRRHPNRVEDKWATTTSISAANPLVTLELSPILILPSLVLGHMIGFLDTASVAGLECTCRALSVAVLASKARAAHAVTNVKPTVDEAGDQKDIEVEPNKEKKVTSEPENVSAVVKTEGDPPKDEGAVQGSRVSKRLRSRIETCGKKAERASRKSSVEFCLFGAVSPQDYVQKEHRLPETRIDRAVQSGLVRPADARGEEDGNRQETRERLGHGSLSSFIASTSLQSSTPLHALFRFVSHVSMHVDSVYSCESHGSSVLSTCLTDCLDLLVKRTTFTSFYPCWSTADSSHAGLSPAELFALDLLHAEFRMKRCERNESVDPSFDGDVNFVAQMIPILTDLAEMKGDSYITASAWSGLKIRCFWLAGSFFLWHARVVQHAAEVRDSENECLQYVERILDVMKESGLNELHTPHLESMARLGPYWKLLSESSLATLRSEIQAASVVVVAQEQFVGALSKIESDNGSEVFATIGTALLQRYEGSPETNGANQLELIDNFLMLHSNELLGESTEDITDWFRQTVPLTKLNKEQLSHLNNPSILTILAVCMNFRPKDDENRFVEVLMNVIYTLNKLLEELKHSPDLTASLQGKNNEDSDDSSLESNDLFSQGNKGDSNVSTVKMYSRLVALLLSTLGSLVERDGAGCFGPNFAKTENCTRLIKSAFSFAQGFARLPFSTSRGDESMEDLFALERACSFLDKLYGASEGAENINSLKTLQANYLASVVESHQLRLRERVERNQVSARVVDGNISSLVRACGDLGSILSSSLCRIKEKKVCRSVLLATSETWLANLCRSVVWLWEACRRRGDEEDIRREQMLPAKMGKELRMPLAALITAVCGSAASTREVRLLPPPHPSLTDVVDSDESVAPSEVDLEYDELIRVIFLAVQCVGLLCESFKDVDLVQGLADVGHRTAPFPVVMERVLNFFADALLANPSAQETSESDPLWADYTYGARTVGSQLDKLLLRAFRALYGFNVAGAGDGKDGKESGASDDPRPTLKPENSRSVAQLYRCMMRFSSHGRRSPPKAALLLISSALPPVQETQQSETIKQYLFDSERSPLFARDQIAALLNRSGNWEEPFSGLEGLWKDSQDQKQKQNDEAEVVRRGLAGLFSQGSMPSFETAVGKDVRAQTLQAESEILNRSEAILYQLTHCNACDCESWFRYSQLCMSKADMIADRLGLTKGFSRSENFVFDAQKVAREKGRSLSELIDGQAMEAATSKTSWLPSVGPDLHVFLRHSWSSFKSLRLLQRTLFEGARDSGHLHVWNEVTSLYTDGKLSRWQEAWGGIFVSSLRIVATRCICLALFILYKGFGISNKARRGALEAEICEALGTALYTQLVGSQNYGYPMKAMTALEKREMAEAALVCYTTAIKEEEDESTRGDNNDGEEKEAKMTWDLYFMQGKCHEKIASTYTGQGYDSSGARAYEECMLSALQSYAASVAEAKGHEKEGVLVVEQQGGSAHGAVEAMYRLHATRLKCLLHALQRCDEERDSAELEALRLSEPFAYSVQTEIEGAPLPIRDRVWNVAVDVVSAMVHCRARHSCFHRSVYRHAQALLWAPILCDPNEAKAEGCFGAVPAVKALKMRGLNSDSAVESASSVMKALFDKKRVQLCGVWVTGTSMGSDTAFQRINMEVRKYDALRGKYVSAYLSCLRLCNKRDDLENFLRWTTACHRDLPSYFSASAAHGGIAPETSHTYDSLIIQPRCLASLHFLSSVKREANSALASVIFDTISRKPPKDVKMIEHKLKLAYSCFLRLNCDPSTLAKRSVRKSVGVKPVVDALVAVHSRISTGLGSKSSDWSVDGQMAVRVAEALHKCSSLFPSLSGSFLTAKKNPKKKKDDNDGSRVLGSKRKEPDGSFTVLKQFKAQVPDGLSPGETFLTELKSGDKIKRIRLTVPSEGASSLRFNLRVPDPGSAMELQEKASEDG